VGLVTPESDKDLPAKNYSFDPHLDPQLVWSGKVENSDFKVDTVSLHRHERIDPLTIIGKLLKKQDSEQQTLFPFFEKPENILPLRNAIEFYKHDQNWSNRLIAGDSLLVMNSLLEKEGMEGKVQMFYIDPPYGIKYGSNFQPFVNKQEVKDRNDDDLTSEPETLKAFRDTWELGIHSYLSYLRTRLFLARKLLSESGSCFIQISDENVHHVRELCDEIFGPENFCNLITFQKTGSISSSGLGTTVDYIVWYAKNKKNMKYRQLYLPRRQGHPSLDRYDFVETPSGELVRLSQDQIRGIEHIPEGKRFGYTPLISDGASKEATPFEYKGEKFFPPRNKHWKTNPKTSGQNLIAKNRIAKVGNQLWYKRYVDDFPYVPLNDRWESIQIGTKLLFSVQTAPKVIERCLLMTTVPGDLVMDITSGSGTTAYVAEKNGRRWIACDSSRVAVVITKQRLVTSIFDYYKLNHPDEGISSDFKYEESPHITLKSIAENVMPEKEKLFDKPLIDKSKIRISGPFTVEAVPSPTVKSLNTEYEKISEIDSSIARTADNRRQQNWRDELLSSGVRGKGGQKIEFSRVEPHPASQWIHAVGETKEPKPKIVAVSFGPEYSLLEQKQVALAIAEAQKLVPKPELIIFAALQFDPEAAKDIDELQWPGVQVLKVQANADLLTLDLKKKRASNESFWLMGQPDVELKKRTDGKYVVEVRGFDYYDTKSDIESGDSSKIAMWMLDTDYDEKSLYSQQVFFPMSGASDGWSKLAKTLKSEIDEQLLEHYSGTKSLPFSAGANKQVAVKIVDDRGIESLRIIKIE